MSYTVWGELRKSVHPPVRHRFDTLVTLADAKRSADRAMKQNEGFDRMVVEEDTGRVRYVVGSLGDEAA